ncbi:MAG TPA: NERD domain-containing protein [Kiritimatiellia bacterium]|nr:NERD domain-containing protein [Kiritimatiellia bacterium]HPS05941.1 NERD domain-containing protein [Kiritimatiellia bacterium]
MNESNRATVHGVPGEHARAVGVMRAIWPLLAALFACGLFAGASMPRLALGVSGAGFLAAAFFLVWAVRDGLKRIDAFFKGARGEESVAVLLAALPRGYHVFHDFTCDPLTTIDHVVVGPTGLFVIETKCWSGRVTFANGTILVNGAVPSRPPLVQARSSARALASYLVDRVRDMPACLPVVCFASDTFQPDLLPYEDALICNASALPPLIATRACHLSADDIERIVKVMEQKNS